MPTRWARYCSYFPVVDEIRFSEPTPCWPIAAVKIDNLELWFVLLIELLWAVVWLLFVFELSKITVPSANVATIRELKNPVGNKLFDYRVNCIIEHENKQGIVIDIEVKEREILSYTIQIGEEEEKKVDVYSLKFLLEKGDVCEANTPKGIMKHKVLKKLENSSYELKFGLATVSNFDYRLIQFVPIEQGMMGNLWRGKKPTKGCLLLNRLKNAGIRQKELSTTTSTNDSTSTDDSNIQVSKNDKGTKNDKNKKIMKNN